MDRRDMVDITKGLTIAQLANLQRYIQTTFANDYRRLYDSTLMRFSSQYVKDGFQDKELGYLRNLRDEQGRLFCRSLKDDSYDGQLDNFERRDFVPSFTWNRHFKSAKKEVVERYTSNGLLRDEIVSGLINAEDWITDFDTSAGWDKILTGKVKKSEYKGTLTQMFKKRYHDIKSLGKLLERDPYLMATRVQAVGAYDPYTGKRTYTWRYKRRYVEMESLTGVLTECPIARPVMGHLRSYEGSAVGKSDEWLSKWIRSRRDEFSHYLVVDYSQYDSTIPAWLLREAFDVVRQMFRPMVGGKKQLFDVIVDDFIRKNMVFKNRVIFADHGTASGSKFTTIINGIVNELITLTWMSAFGIQTHVYNIMGDDNIMFFNEVVDKKFVKKVASYISHNFGIIVKPEKTDFGSTKRDPEYLSRFWGKTGPYRDAGTVLSLMAYPERERKYDANLEPWMVFYSYVLAYPKTLGEHYDIARFLEEHKPNIYNVKWTLKLRREVPYNIRLYVESLGLARP